MTKHGFTEFYPPFSWDTVPVYQMFADARLFTEQDVGVIAKTSDFICIEKQHGIGELGAGDLGAKHAIRQFKAVKPQMACLVYLNSAYAYPFISRSKVFDYRTEINKPENATCKSFLLTDPETEELAYREGDHVLLFDVLNPDFRDWWVETVGAFVRDASGDGLFVDQMHGFAWLRPDRAPEVAEAQARMMRMAKQTIGRDKILLLNNAAHIPELFEIGDAFMFEHYNAELTSKEKIVEDWALMKTIATAGKISVWRIGVEHDGLYLNAAPETKAGDRKHDTLEAISRERITYYLAAFLIGAQEQSYFQYGWGWELKTGPLCAYPELKRPLGAPQGDYTRDAPDGWTFHRKFEHASVTVDLERQTGSITRK